MLLLVLPLNLDIYKPFSLVVQILQFPRFRHRILCEELESELKNSVDMYSIKYDLIANATTYNSRSTQFLKQIQDICVSFIVEENRSFVEYMCVERMCLWPQADSLINRF